LYICLKDVKYKKTIARKGRQGKSLEQQGRLWDGREVGQRMAEESYGRVFRHRKSWRGGAQRLAG